MNNHWLKEAKKRLKKEFSSPSEIPLERLKAQGMIDDQGEVTGHLQRWNAFLAVTEVKQDRPSKKITHYRCLKPVFGMPGGAEIDISRESMVEYLTKGKKIITASWDDHLKMWKKGEEVHLSPRGFIRTDRNNREEDNLGSLPEFSTLRSRL